MTRSQHPLRIPRTLREAVLIPAACGLGAPDARCAEGPEHLIRDGLVERLRADGLGLRAQATLRPSRARKATRIGTLRRYCAALAGRVETSIVEGALPIVLGGDHSIAIGTWSGAARAFSGRLGLVWIDAHMDAHTAKSSPSGNPHGMPLAALLGRTRALRPSARAGGAALDPRRVCLIGVRDFEPEERELLDALGVRVITMREVEERGFADAFAEARRIACTQTDAYGITVDLDALDPHDAPGVNLPVAGGLPAAALARALAEHALDERLAALEIVEYDPQRDDEARTAQVVESLVSAALGRAPRVPARVERDFGAHNYAPLPVTLVRASGSHAWDDDGRRYLDMMSAYSAVSVGHAHPRVLEAMARQAGQLAVTSRAFHTDRLPEFMARVCALTGMDKAMPANTGLEAVEVALKAARKWAYEVKGVAPERAEIIACEGNFHGRSIAIVAMSSEDQYRQGFGPFPAGFRRVSYADPRALEAAITPHTAAFLVEPIQGEAGIVVPPEGYLRECARICRERNVLLIADEVQTGLGRTGRMLACEHDGVRPDGLILGKALGGGVFPVSMFLARAEVMDVFRPGDHGSTFGGNPLAAAVGMAALDVIEDERLCERSAELGAYLLQTLERIRSPLVREVRGRGLFVGIDFDPALVHAYDVALWLLRRGILTRDTHDTVIRLAPPLTIERTELDEAIDRVNETIEALEAAHRSAGVQAGASLRQTPELAARGKA